MENNGVLSSLFKKGLKSGKDIPFIYEENYLSAIKKVVSFCAPYSKVCTVCFSSTAEELLFSITNAVRAVGAEMVSFVTERQYDDDLKSFAYLFNFPEDVRAMVVLDEELFDKAAYFCSLRNIPIIFVPKNPIGVICVKDTVLLKNNGKFEMFKILCEKHLIIDYELYKGRYSSLYGHLMSKLVTLTDYRIIGVTDRSKLNVKGYSFLKDGVVSSFSLAYDSDIERIKALISNAITAEVGLNLMGNIRYISSESASSYLLKRDADLGKRELFSALAILSVYKIFTETKNPILNFIDYNKREKELLRITGFENGVTLKNLIEQSDFIRKNKIALKAGFLSLKSEIAGYCALKDRIIEKYKTFRASETDIGSLDFAVRFSGDLFNNINGMSILREEGFLEESYE